MARSAALRSGIQASQRKASPGYRPSRADRKLIRTIVADKGRLRRASSSGPKKFTAVNICDISRRRARTIVINLSRIAEARETRQLNLERRKQLLCAGKQLLFRHQRTSHTSRQSL